MTQVIPPGFICFTIKGREKTHRLFCCLYATLVLKWLVSVALLRPPRWKKAYAVENQAIPHWLHVQYLNNTWADLYTYTLTTVQCELYHCHPSRKELETLGKWLLYTGDLFWINEKWGKGYCTTSYRGGLTSQFSTSIGKPLWKQAEGIQMSGYLTVLCA